MRKIIDLTSGGYILTTLVVNNGKDRSLSLMVGITQLDGNLTVRKIKGYNQCWVWLIQACNLTVRNIKGYYEFWVLF